MKRRRSDLHTFPSNWVNASKELQFNCDKCNLLFVKSNRFNTHMKKHHYLALGRHRITLLGKLYWGSQLHETKAILLQWMQLYICKIRQIWYTHEETKLPCPGKTQSYSPWETVSRVPTTWNKCNLIAVNAFLYLYNFKQWQ